MRIVVFGGTGLIGRKLIERLAAGGHQAVAASRSTGVDAVTGEGLAEALAGAQVAIDVTNAPAWGDDEVLQFFRTSSRNIVAAGRAAGVGHHIPLTIVGADRNPGSGYQRAKVAQEEIVAASGVPYTIVRATQFYEFLAAIADAATTDGTVHAPVGQFQPVAADDVAATLAEIAVAEPADAIVDLAGPEALPMGDYLRRFLEATGDPRKVVDDPAATYFGALLTETSLVPTGPARIGATTFDEWLSRTGETR